MALKHKKKTAGRPPDDLDWPEETSSDAEWEEWASNEVIWERIEALRSNADARAVSEEDTLDAVNEDADDGEETQMPELLNDWIGIGRGYQK